MDFIKELGYLAIVSRMKRLTDSLMKGGGNVYQSLNIDFEPRIFTVFYLILTQEKPLSISEISSSLQISHPAVIQAAKMLTTKGLIDSFQDDKDRRIRRLVLTAKGKRLGDSLHPIWNDIGAATSELFVEAGVDMLSVIQKIENRLEKENLTEKILKRIKERQFDEVEILDYSPEYKEHFRALNEEWLKKYFNVEELDRKILNEPEKEIIKKGGAVFFACLDSKIVGTAALLKVDETTYEICKMAVTEKAQGQQAGRKLADMVLKKAKKMGAKKIILKTDARLRHALNLYLSLGFKVAQAETTASGKHEREKQGIFMKLELT
ncbi:MAG: bifunctional helix-turn-helix transcriptional regulator/GNAT family N-acetyltransferase [Candidatus Aminicenantes bacterium]|nr:bifunctional helix-turn-helix transcriptional regulator/GNAT family N-acetyltransferase [Candidatus Aminicenantes bacterium]